MTEQESYPRAPVLPTPESLIPFRLSSARTHYEHSTNSLFNLYGVDYPILETSVRSRQTGGGADLVKLGMINMLVLLLGFLVGLRRNRKATTEAPNQSSPSKSL